MYLLAASPPAEDTLVGTGKARSALHAAVAFYAIERVLIASSTATQHALSPPTHFHTRVRTHNVVTYDNIRQYNYMHTYIYIYTHN